MLFVFVVSLIFCSVVNNPASSTDFKDCGSELGTIQSFDVTDCPKLPCQFVKGNTYGMNLTFQAKAPSATATISIHGIIAGIPISFPLPESSACKLNCKCPINDKDVNDAELSLPVLPSYPSLSLYVQLEIKNNDLNKDYVCLKFPATIVSSPKSKLVGWQHGKLFEILNKKKSLTISK